MCLGAPQGGTRAAPAEFNDRNQQEPANYWPSADRCAYALTLRERGGGSGAGGALLDALGPEGEWEQVAALPFVDNARSPPLPRAFFLPWLSARRNHVVDYVLLQHNVAAAADAPPAEGRRRWRW